MTRDDRLQRDRRRWYYPPPSSYIAAVEAEWRAAPLGRLGNVLWTDIERYLEFMAIARGDVAEGSTPARAGSGRGHVVTYLRFR